MDWVNMLPERLDLPERLERLVWGEMVERVRLREGREDFRPTDNILMSRLGNNVTNRA